MDNNYELVGKFSVKGKDMFILMVDGNAHVMDENDIVRLNKMCVREKSRRKVA